jgi:hypothetical protein
MKETWETVRATTKNPTEELVRIAKGDRKAYHQVIEGRELLTNRQGMLDCGLTGSQECSKVAARERKY